MADHSHLALPFPANYVPLSCLLLVPFLLLALHPAKLAQQASKAVRSLVPVHWIEVFWVEDILADVWLQWDEHGAVREGGEQVRQEELVLQKAEAEAMHEDDGPGRWRGGGCGRAGRREAEEVPGGAYARDL